VQQETVGGGIGGEDSDDAMEHQQQVITLKT